VAESAFLPAAPAEVRPVRRRTILTPLVAVAVVAGLLATAPGAGATPARPKGLTPFVTDTYTRTVNNGWGTADTGGAWSLSGTASNFQVANGVGTMNQTAAGVGQSARLLATTATSADVTVSVRASKGGTGSGEYARVIGRRTSANDEYRGRVRFAANGAVYAMVTKLAGSSSETAVGAEVLVGGLTYSAATTYRMRVVVTGSNPTTIMVKIWNASASQPTAFNVVRTDAAAAIQGAGSIGLATALSATSTNAPVLFTFDNLSAQPYDAPPVASYTPSCVARSCSFDASASTDSDGTIASYAWTFGDGASDSGVTTNHEYAWDRRWTVTLTVTDNMGVASTTSQSVAVGTVPSAVLAAVDPTTTSGAEHQTVVEPTTAVAGNTIVTTYQVGRYATQASGAAAVAYATSTDGGATWTSGILPGTSTASTPAGSCQRVVNMIVAHDDAQGEWMITSHCQILSGSTWIYDSVTVSRSTDGLTWSLPITLAQGDQPDKGWVTCDNAPASPFYGRCYLLYSSQSMSKRFQAVYTDDGGATWSNPVGTTSNATGYDVNPVVRPDGTVVVLATQNNLNNVVAYRSTDGGVSWSDPVTITTIQKHTLTAGLRTRSKPSAAVDATGTVYVSWYDCRFRASCTSNDIVWTSSTDGVTWGPIQRIPVDPVSSTVEHFVASLGVTPGTSGATAQLTVVFYEMPDAACTASTCSIDAVTTVSNDGGQTWAPTAKLNGTSMKVGWLPNTTLGHMLSDYDNVAYLGSTPVAGIVIANPLAGSTANDYRQHLYLATL
jgi:hypothetical protein